MYFASIFLLLLQLSQCPKKAETHMLSSAEEVDALCRWKSLQKARRPGTSTLWAGMLKAAAVSSDLALTLPAAAALFPFPLVFYLPALKPSFKHCHQIAEPLLLFHGSTCWLFIFILKQAEYKKSDSVNTEGCESDSKFSACFF